MYRYIKYYVALLLVITSLSANAQDRKPEIKVANEHFDRYQYDLAAPIYEKLARKKSVKTVTLEKLAYSYKEMDNYDKASQWYQAVTQRNDATANSFLLYGDVLKNQGNYIKAKEVYAQYKQKDTKDITARIMGCDSAVMWLKRPTSNTVTNLSKINTSASEWGATVYKDKSIIFTSDSLRNSLFGKEINKRKYGWTGRSYIKLYQFSSESSGTPTITQFSKELNDFKYHVGPIAFTSDYNTGYFTVTNPDKISHTKDPNYNFYGARKLEIYSSDLKNGTWQQPIAFPYNNPSSYSVGHAAISKDGNTLYFSSDMTGGIGKTDLWYSEKNKDGSWSPPKNCGPTINTPEDEEFPTLGDNNILYFSSDGLPGMGGLDIFSTTGQKDQWTKPINLKSPVNSSTDDFYLIMTDTSKGYLTSNRKGGHGNDDIYTCNIVPVIVTPPVVPVVVVKEEEIVDVTETYIIYYDFDKFNIRRDAAAVLDKLAEFLKKHPNDNIKISSYTDSRGKSAYNMNLSQKRARSAVTYLNKKGISKKRISAKGYGETHLKNKCKKGVKCTEAEHQLNRRTEVLIISL
ncbi:OmpA family protein [Flavobacterium sp. LS1R49]|uniref:OmpA family protein n=1 Tax=Flavobacterium shii TaxID=2987687 RepID=A0A9X3BZE7_9FLAO|nr:OmpA family protein [Flavobacterium shii]MCV9930205.1 OmpA family protein [Flavobacterium shii]